MKVPRVMGRVQLGRQTKVGASPSDRPSLLPARSLIGDEVGDGRSEPRLTQEKDDLAAVVAAVVRHMVQHLVEALLKYLTLAVLIGDGAREVVGRQVDQEGLPALSARSSAESAAVPPPFLPL